MYESRHSNGGAFYRVSFSGGAIGDGDSGSSSHNYSDSYYCDAWSSSDSGCGYDYSCSSSGYTSNYYGCGYDSSSNASYNYAANWSWNIDGTKSYSLSNDVTGHHEYSCYYDYDYVSYSSDYGFGCGCCCHQSSDDDDYCCYNPPLNYNDTIQNTGWGEQCGQTNLPQQFNIRWSPFSGGICDGDSCGYGYYSYNGASFSAPNFSVTMYDDESYYDEEYETNEVWHKGRSTYGGGGYLYSGTAPTSHIQNGSLPTAPSTFGNTSKPSAPLIYAATPSFNNYANINPKAILDEKCTPPPIPEPPAPATPPLSTHGISPPIKSESWWWAGTKAALRSVGTGIVNLGIGGYNMVKEAALTYVDIQAVSIDTIATLAGHPIGWEELSAQGKSYKDSTGLDIATNAARSGLAGGTLGASELVIGTYQYTQDGDADTFQQHMGTVATGNLVAAGMMKLGNAKSQQSSLRNCFIAGTLVSRYSPDNIEQKELVPIEQIKFGDRVWAFNRATDNWETQTVLDTYRRGYVGDFVAINIGNDVINATGGHPFWVLQGKDLESRPLCECLPTCDQEMTPQGRWVYARDLRLGDIVRSRLQETLTISGLRLTLTKTVVYNFLVDELHNYAVGQDEILVHNMNAEGKYESYEYKQRARDKNDNMKPSHATEQKNVNEAKAKLTKGQQGIFEQELQKQKGRGNHTVSRDVLNEIADEIRQNYPNLQ